MDCPEECPILVVGIGNPQRGDDSVGQVVASEVRRRGPRFLRVCEFTGDGASLIALWEGASTVIVVDAVLSGAPPGTIHRLDAIEQPLPGWRFRLSTHSVGLAEAVELARVTKRLPERLVVYGIEGQFFGFGAELSVGVRHALPAAVERVLDEVEKIANVIHVRGRDSWL